MDGALRDVNEEWFFLGSGFVDEFQTKVDKQIGGKPVRAENRIALRIFFAVEIKLFGAVAVGFDRKINFAECGIERAHEAVLPRDATVLLAEMPFAGHGGEVTGIAQDFGNRHAAREKDAVEAARLWFDFIVEPAHAGLLRIQAAEESGARGATAWRVVKLAETQSISGERVQIRRGDFAAETADVGEAHVVDEHDDDVRALGGDGVTG
jgi:hypothetical protein